MKRKKETFWNRYGGRVLGVAAGLVILLLGFAQLQLYGWAFKNYTGSSVSPFFLFVTGIVVILAALFLPRSTFVSGDGKKRKRRRGRRRRSRK